MTVWAISDLHFDSARKQSMDRFGKDWEDHVARITTSWRKQVKETDLVLLGGDLSSVAQTIEKAKADLERISALPGKKVLVSGNHDIWLTKEALQASAWRDEFLFLQGNCIQIEDKIICGLRGWLSPNDPCYDALDRNRFNLEMQQLQSALDQAKELIASKENQNKKLKTYILLHFPPFTTKGIKTAFWELILENKVATNTVACIYGHFHIHEEWDNLKKITQESKLIHNIDCYLTTSAYLKHTLKQIH